MANTSPRRAGPKLSLNEKIKEAVADLKKTSWLERSVILFSLILFVQVSYFFLFVPGDSDIEVHLAQKRAEIASSRIPPSRTLSDEESKNEAKNVLAEIDKMEAERQKYKYDPAGKRDPFMQYGMTAKIEDDASKTPLERYDLGQLKLTAVLAGFGEPRAIVENASGKGFPVKVGTKIGRNNGTIVEIDNQKVVIRERFVNFTGDEQVKDVELRLRIKGTGNEGSQSYIQ